MGNLERTLAHVREELAKYAYRRELLRAALTDNDALRATETPWVDLPADERQGFYKQADDQIAIIRDCGLIDQPHGPDARLTVTIVPALMGRVVRVRTGPRRVISGKTVSCHQSCRPIVWPN